MPVNNRRIMPKDIGIFTLSFDIKIVIDKVVT